MSGLEVIGGISAVITIVEASVEIWDNAQKDIKLPETFKIVARRLPLLLSTLQICHDQLDHIKDTLPSDVVESFQGVLQNSKAQARLLRDIFEETVPGEDAKRLQKLRAAVKTLGKGRTVERILESISKDTLVLASYHSIQAVRPDLTTDLEKLIVELQNAEPSVEEDALSSSAFQNYNYGGQQNISTGHSRYSGHGDQHVYGGVGAINQYSGSVHQHLQSRVPPRLNGRNKKCGLCLGDAPLIDADLFKGRSIELEKMKSQLQLLNTACDRRCIVLGGIGGVGKTQLAIDFARRHRSAYNSIFWLNATSEATLNVSFRQLAEVVFDQQSLTEFEDEAILEGVRQWLSRHDNTPWLIIFDSYDEPGMYKIEKFYPKATHGSIIVTTRLPSQVNGFLILVHPLHPFACRLAERLDGLPLALATAGAYLAHSPWSFERYLEEYLERWNVNSCMPTKLPEYDRTLYTTWDLSYMQLQQQEPDALQLLKLLAYFDNQRIWPGLLLSGRPAKSRSWLPQMVRKLLYWPTEVDSRPAGMSRLLADDINLEGLMNILSRYCFLEVQVMTESYSMHNCVHDWTLYELNREIDPQLYWYAFDCVAASIDEGNCEDLGQVKYGRVSQHAVRLVHHRFEACDISNSGLLERLDKAVWIANMLHEQGQLSAAEKMYTPLLAWREEELGPNNALTLEIVHHLGNLYAAQGKLDEAEKMYVRALAVRTPNRILPLCTLNSLGVLYSKQGKRGEAEQIFRQALAGKEKVLGPDHSLTFDVVHNLGVLYADQGKLSEAEQMYLRALAGHEKTLEPDHTSTLKTVHTLGVLYADQGKLSEAEQMFLRALAGYEKVLGRDHTSTLDNVHNLGVLYTKQGKLAEAEEMYQRALAGFRRYLGQDDPRTRTTVDNLAKLRYL